MIDTYVGSDFSIVCRPTGCLDWTGAAALRHAVHNVLCPEINLHIDLRHLNFVDAVGMSALVGSVRRVRAVGGKARIQNARDDRGPIGPRVCVVVRWRRVMTASVPSGPWPRCSGSSWSSRGLSTSSSRLPLSRSTPSGGWASRPASSKSAWGSGPRSSSSQAGLCCCCSGSASMRCPAASPRSYWRSSCVRRSRTNTNRRAESEAKRQW